MSASTTPDNITYPVSTDAFGPLESAFATLATTVQTALNNTKTYRTADHVSLAAIIGMASGALAGPKLNGLLDAAFGVLEEMGNEDFSALLQDRMDGRRFTEFLRRTGARHPIVYREVLRALGPMSAARWGVRLAREALA